MSFDDQLNCVPKILGEEIRAARKARGWTRRRLRAEMRQDKDLSLQTMATHELGTRQMTVTRLLQYCVALDLPVEELLGRVTARVRLLRTRNDSRVMVDLAALACTADPRLSSLLRWASVRAKELPARAQPIEALEPHAVEALAKVAGITPGQLTVALRELEPAAS
ncbi:helix-turn-helix domain-containing protein [Amycolatopsis sp. NPDC059657]|uniref:helix-turn-helix domain-containing protein n=1 Tax=Amycolatopsis sp. NPDC059657 TaxID=3346899 RepID=UPI00366B3A01